MQKQQTQILSAMQKVRILTGRYNEWAGRVIEYKPDSNTYLIEIENGKFEFYRPSDIAPVSE